jgi:hypothetical protein
VDKLPIDFIVFWKADFAKICLLDFTEFQKEKLIETVVKIAAKIHFTEPFCEQMNKFSE